jgi:hypothetical protein
VSSPLPMASSMRTHVASPSPMLESRRLEARAVQHPMDGVDQRDRVAWVDVDGLHQDSRDLGSEPPTAESPSVLDAPHACLDADARVKQCPHDVHRAGLRHVDGRVVRGAPGPDQLDAPFEIGFDPGAGRDADGHTARITHRRDHMVHELSGQPFVPIPIARMKVNRPRAGGHARDGVSHELLDGDRHRRMVALRQRAIERRLQEHHGKVAGGRSTRGFSTMAMMTGLRTSGGSRGWPVGVLPNT